MSTGWRQLCADAGLRVRDDGIVIGYQDGRSQRVQVEEGVLDRSGIRIWSMVARAADLEGIEDPEDVAWARNRETDLVGFKLDRRGRLFGESWVPLEALTAEEWSLYVHAVARACDRFEYLLTGRDVE